MKRKHKSKRSLWAILRWPFWIVVLALLAYESTIFAQVVWFRWNNPGSTAFIDAERERLQQNKSALRIRQQWVTYQNISRSAKQAVIAAEDSGFVTHDGVDWEAIEKAAQENLKRGKIRRGGSTITMQLAKNLFLSSDRSYLRKGQEVVIAAMLELVMDKRRILELYLNTAEWGLGVFGIEAAARHYFDVPAAQLDPMQSAWLASVLPSPKRFDRQRDSEWISERALIIFERMPKVATPK
ncbi:MAG: monofunctional biosynthetic peptidoglycan transglycosylase [Burkholderiaceae bacterium]|nr:monofunctional biosynthetic peptidoglycan transglycosylase [Burkholderiaceae bacterium]